jgi:hypothetical protein
VSKVEVNFIKSNLLAIKMGPTAGPLVNVWSGSISNPFASVTLAQVANTSIPLGTKRLDLNFSIGISATDIQKVNLTFSNGCTKAIP